MVKSQQDPLETLQAIRSMMERSSRFISLSGLSGISAGIVALLGAAAIYWNVGMLPFSHKLAYYEAARSGGRSGLPLETFFLLDGALVLLLAIAGGIFFTTRQARGKGQPIWGPLTQRLLLNLAVPLLTGGVFILALLKYHLIGLVAPSTLVFYGLALLNASKYTYNDIRYLGLSEIALGLVGLFLPGYGLELWSLGFGILHILYGALMYYKYERAPKPEFVKKIIHKLNKSFDNRTRLGIMSMLMVNDWVEFKVLRDLLEVTDGNLASHIKALEKEAYVEVKKQFVGRKPQTTYRVTPLGRKAFNDHLDTLEELLGTGGRREI